MFLRVPKLLSADRLAEIDVALAKAAWADGRATAGAIAGTAKHNRQLDRAKTEKDIVESLDRIVLQAMQANPTIRAGVLPTRILPPYFARYSEGMSYGAHSDNPVMGEGQPIRTDASITVFLSPPDSYEGGDLVIQTDTGEARIKLDKGDAVVYPTGAVHAVTEVKSGERVVCVTWMQSMIADPYRRQLVYELDLAHRAVAEKLPNTPEQRTLLRVYGNLVRLWGEI